MKVKQLLNSFWWGVSDLDFVQVKVFAKNGKHVPAEEIQAITVTKGDLRELDKHKKEPHMNATVLTFLFRDRVLIINAETKDA